MGDESEEEFQADEESEEEEEFLEADEESDDDDDDKPLASLKKASPADNDNDDDSDDDIPLAALRSPAKEKKPAAAKKPKDKPKAKKKASEAKVSKPAATIKKKTKSSKKETASSSPSNGSFHSASAALYGSGCVKGQVIQELLCRWWYAISWPTNVPEQPPKHYDSLDGMPGVFVCTFGTKVGHVMDTRDKTKCPNFCNFANKPCSELQELLIEALKKQKEALVAVEGPGTDTETKINTKLRWAEKLNADKADKEAIKVLKGAKLSLAEA